MILVLLRYFWNSAWDTLQFSKELLRSLLMLSFAVMQICWSVAISWFVMSIFFYEIIFHFWPLCWIYKEWQILAILASLAFLILLDCLVHHTAIKSHHQGFIIFPVHHGCTRLLQSFQSVIFLTSHNKCYLFDIWTLNVPSHVRLTRQYLVIKFNYNLDHFP